MASSLSVLTRVGLSASGASSFTTLVALSRPCARGATRPIPQPFIRATGAFVSAHRRRHDPHGRGQHDGARRWRPDSRSDGAPADFLRRAEIPLHERRRHLDAGHRVEPVTRLVGGKQPAHVRLERQQIANRVRIFGSIQPVDERAPGVRRQTRGVVQCAGQRGEERVALGGARSRYTGRRHHAGADLPDHLLPHICMRRHVGKLGAIQRQAAGLQSIVVTGDAVGGDRLLDVRD